MSAAFTQPNFTFSQYRNLIVLCVIVVGLTIQPTQQNTVTAQTIDWRVKRQGLEFQFGQDLVKIADWCNSNGLSRQVPITYALKQNRDLDRQYLFLPQTEAMPDPQQQDGELKAWLEKVNTARIAHAARIFELAKEALAADATSTAYQLLYEVIHHDRDHKQVRRILDHQPKDGAWHVASNSFRTRPSPRPHDFLSLAKGQFNLVETAHFKIASTASEARTRVLAAELELWHTVWRQTFFDYWGSKTALKASFNGRQAMRIPGRKFDIVFFQNQQQYATLLGEHVRGVGVSSGYYSNKLKTSFFYDGDATTQQTWRHELTHQLFRQSKGRSPDNAFDKNHVWLDEGVATYAESMVKFDNRYVTLGGFEAQRTQHARLQALLEKASLPVAQLNAMTQDNWQALGNPKLYAQSAAIVDTLMNEGHGQHQTKFIDLLKAIYYKQANPSTFERKLKLSFEQVDQMFLKFLKIDTDKVSKHLSKPETRTFLSFTGAKLTNGDYQKIGKCVNLTVLDLSGHALAANDLRPLSNCTQLHQLILSSCQFEPNALLSLSRLPSLTKIDLSLSQIGPTQANEIAQLKQLKPGLNVVQ